MAHTIPNFPQKEIMSPLSFPQAQSTNNNGKISAFRLQPSRNSSGALERRKGIERKISTCSTDWYRKRSGGSGFGPIHEKSAGASVSSSFFPIQEERADLKDSSSPFFSSEYKSVRENYSRQYNYPADYKERERASLISIMAQENYHLPATRPQTTKVDGPPEKLLPGDRAVP